MKLDHIITVPGLSIVTNRYRERSLLLDGTWYVSRRFPDRIEVHVASNLSEADMDYLRSIQFASASGFGGVFDA